MWQGGCQGSAKSETACTRVIAIAISVCFLSVSLALADELHDSVRAHDLSAVSKLLEDGADTETTDFFLGTPLHIAVSEGQTEIARMLIAHGANLEAVSELQGARAMHLAAELGQKELLLLLIKSGAEIDARDKSDRTPLFRATVAEEAEAVKLLLTKGVNLEARDSNYQQTPLLAAALAGNIEIVRLLVDAGADIDARDVSGRASMRLAATAEAYRGSGNDLLPLLQYLANHGADINAPDNAGQTPLAWAEAGSGRLEVYKEIAQMLRRLGATE